MPTSESLILFTTAALLMNISPGPSNLYVMARTIAQGTQAGVVAALGLAAGSMVHVAATVLGLAAVFEYSPLTYTVVKLLGAAYLIYLGISYWLANSDPEKPGENVERKTTPVIFRESLIVEVTNPKTALFFLALLPQFVSPETGPVAPQLLVLGLIVTLSAIPCDLLVAFFAGKVAHWLKRHPSAQTIQDRVSGTILTGLGSYIIVDELLPLKN